MRNQKGSTFVDVLIVVGLIGIIAAIATPAWMRAREHQRGTADFKVYFGVDLPHGDLSRDQKTVLRPFVAQRLGELWAVTVSDHQVLEELSRLPATQDPAVVQERLKAATRASIASQASRDNFTRAWSAAKLRGLIE